MSVGGGEDTCVPFAYYSTNIQLWPWLQAVSLLPTHTHTHTQTRKHTKHTTQDPSALVIGLFYEWKIVSSLRCCHSVRQHLLLLIISLSSRQIFFLLVCFLSGIVGPIITKGTIARHNMNVIVGYLNHFVAGWDSRVQSKVILSFIESDTVIFCLRGSRQARVKTGAGSQKANNFQREQEKMQTSRERWGPGTQKATMQQALGGKKG